MKRIILTFVGAMLLCVTAAFGQAPEGINYQGVARDASGNPLQNQAVGLQFSIRSGSPSGTLEYQETHTVTTNNLGLFTLQIGNGTAVSGTFSAIGWGSNSHFVEVELDPAGGSNYTSLGTNELLSVPYALHAKTVENDNVTDADADSTNELNTGAALNGTDLELTDAGGTLTVDLSSLQDGVTDADADSTNELNTGAALNGTDLELTDAGGTLTVDLSSLQDGVTDADADSTNELNTGAALVGTNLTITDAGGTITVNLSTLQDGVNDADADPTNEIQVLSFSNDSILLSNGGGGVALPNDGDWIATGNDINHPVGNVGINSTTYANRLHVVENNSATTAAVWAEGVFGPTYGQMGVQGDTDHQGILSLDISGNEIGLLGISTGASTTDNYGVYGHSNGWGGRFEHDASGNFVLVGGANSALQLVDGNQATGRVLTSDAAGNATWAVLPTSGDNDWTVSSGSMNTGTGINMVGVRTPAPLTDIHLTQSNATTAGAGGMRFQYTTTFWKIFHSGIHFSFVDDGTRVAYVEGGTGNYVQPSDGRLKKNVTPIVNVKSRLLQLRPVSYHYNQMADTDQKAVGFIAQEVGEIFPEILRESEDGMKALSYSDFAVLSVRAVQEQQQEIDAQNARIEALEKELETLKQMILDQQK